MSISRTIEPELLDMLTPEDPCAIRARRDLQRVNIIMGQTAIWKRIMITASLLPQAPRVMVELGGSSGSK